MDRMLDLAEYIIVVFGSTAALSSFLLFTYFIRSDKSVGKAVAFVFLAECIGLLITVAFAVVVGVVDTEISPWIQLVMRAAMFSTALCSSVHMAFSLDKLLRGQDR